MTKTLKAGPELDAQVAVELMGYRWVRVKKCNWLTSDPIGTKSCAANRMRQGLAFLASGKRLADPGFWFYREAADSSGKNVCNTEYITLPGEAARWGYPKRYSTDWSAAGEVLDKLIALDCRPWLQYHGRLWKCNAHIGWFSSESPKVAICLAALEAAKQTQDVR